jgi:hypothetical protein
MRRLLLAALVGLFLLPTPALAKIVIWSIAYNPPGYDSGSNTHRNKEYIVIKNTYSTTKSLAGWYVTDNSGKRYTFPRGSRLAEGQSVRIHTGNGTNSRYHKYWGSRRYVWGNNGDRATLYNKGGTRVDWCKYGSNATSPYKC